jgi:hypothetical protein
MSDEKSDAVSQREVRFALAALSVSASKAGQFARRAPVIWPVQIFVAFLPAVVNFGLATYSLLLVFAGQSAQWQDFRTRTLATLAWTGCALILLSVVISARLFPPALVLRIHKGMQGLRQISASGDDRLTPKRSAVIWTDISGLESVDSVALGPLNRLDSQRAELLLRFGLVLLVLGAGLGALTFAPFLRMTSLDTAESGVTAAACLLLAAFALVRAIPRLRSFTITAHDQGFQWRRPAPGLRLRSVQAPWRDARALLTFRVHPDGKSADVDEVFLLDTTSEALAWRITPKTPSSVREAHERFVRMANEHVHLRDITASLKNLLEAPETRSFEYAVIALSGKALVPPAVRKVLTTPVREAHFLRGYLILVAILLALLVAAGLLLQFGVIPAGSF